MNEEHQSPSRLRRAGVGAALAAGAGLLFAGGPQGRPLANLSFDWPFLWRGPQPVEGVMLVYLDELSAAQLGQMWGNAVWDRKVHAQVINRLKDCHAKAVIVDIVFDLPSTNDQPLVDALRDARQAGTPVILGGDIKISATIGGSFLTKQRHPISELTNVADWGLAESGSPPLRRHFSEIEGVSVSSLAMRATELLGRNPARALAPERWINFYGPPGFLRHCSYADALDPAVTGAGTFSNKVCFLGGWNSTPLAGGLLQDEWHTPYSRWGGARATGLEMTATVYLNLERGDWLTRLPHWDELCILLAAGILFGTLLTQFRPTIAIVAGVGLAVAVAALACWGMWRHYIWFSWLTVAGVQMPVALGWSMWAGQRRLTRAKALWERSAGQSVPATSAAAADTVVVASNAPATPSRDWLPIIPDHTMLRCVGRGGYGEVWLARNAIGTYHAVKIIRRAAFEHADPFEREFRGLQKFMPISRSHPGLVQVLHVGRRDPEGFIYYVMEAADDENTGSQINPESYSPRNLAKEIGKRGHLPVAECLQLGIALAAALEFLHQQHLIHRDIKPANIIFVKGAPKFADIGLVTEAVATGGAVTYVGTKGYIAPEGPGTLAADVYSLGKVLYEASMGLNCESFPELPPSLAQRADHDALLQLNKVILKACRQDPRQRYQTAAEMQDDLLRTPQRSNQPR